MCTQPAVHESMLPHSRTWLLCKINQNPFQKYGCFATKINTQLWTPWVNVTQQAATDPDPVALRPRKALPSDWSRAVERVCLCA